MLRRRLGIFVLHCLRRLYFGRDGEALLAQVRILPVQRGIVWGVPFFRYAFLISSSVAVLSIPLESG